MAGGAVWYRARITLDQIGLHDTPAGFRLSPGMPVTSDVLVGKRTIMAYFLIVQKIERLELKFAA